MGDIKELKFAQVETSVCSQPAEHKVRVLERAVKKIVATAEEVGLSVDDLIELLRSGMSVGDLLDYVGTKVPRSHSRSRS